LGIEIMKKKGMEKFPTKVGGDHSLNNISSGGGKKGYCLALFSGS